MDFKKQLAIRLLIALLMVGAAIGATEFISGDLESRSEKIVSQKRELALRAQATGFLADLKSDFEKARPLFDILDNALPAQDDLIDLSRQMVELGKRFNLEAGFSFGSENPGKNGVPGSIGFSVTGKGSYENIVRFLKEVEKSSLYIKVNSIDLTRQPGGNEFSMVMSAEVYHQ